MHVLIVWYDAIATVTHLCGGTVCFGSSLVRAPVNYGNWEADKLQSCHCDDGWEGYDCSQRSCPKGRDPTKPTDTSRSLYRRPQEVFELQCQADSGYFAIFALGR